VPCLKESVVIVYEDKYRIDGPPRGFTEIEIVHEEDLCRDMTDNGIIWDRLYGVDTVVVRNGLLNHFKYDWQDSIAHCIGLVKNGFVLGHNVDGSGWIYSTKNNHKINLSWNGNREWTAFDDPANRYPRYSFPDHGVANIVAKTWKNRIIPAQLYKSNKGIRAVLMTNVLGKEKGISVYGKCG